MINILIADDEPLQRKYLRTVLEDRKDCRVVADVGDGEEAVAKGLEYRPDMVFLDIRMPGLDGIEVARRLKVALPHVKIIIISAFSEFQYAKDSVGIGVAEYLLKPVESDDIIKVADRVIAEIEQEQQERSEADLVKSRLAEAMPLIRIGFVMDLVNGNIVDNEDVVARAALFGINNPICLAMAIWLDSVKTQENMRSELEKQIARRNVGDEIDSALAKWPEHLFISPGNGQYTVLLAAEKDIDEGSLKKMATDLAESICESVRKNTSFTVTVGIGRKGTGAEGISRSYREAVVAGEYRVLYGGDQPIHADDVEVTGEYANVLSKGYEKNLVVSISIGDWDRTIRSFLSLWAEYINGDPKISRVRSKIAEISNVAVRAASESSVVIDSLDESREEFEAQMERETNPDVMKEKMINWLNDIVNKIRTSREFRNVSLIDKAVHYMENHYQDEIGLDDVAGQVFLSTCYFSRLFKQVKGWSFTEYLTSIRMEEARKLLTTTSYSVADVAGKVGFRDARYFSQVFKRHTGKTPGSYRREEASRILSTRD